MNATHQSTDPDMRDPRAVSDHVLEVTRQAYVDRDEPAFVQRFLLPQTIGSFDGDLRLTTPRDVADLFARTCRYFDDHGVLDLRRHTIEARFVTPAHVQATFVSQHVLRNFVPADEIVAHGDLRLDAGIWKIAESRYATDNVRLSLALTRPSRKHTPK